MAYYRMVFGIVYLTVLCMYFHNEVRQNFGKRAINKIVLATMFLVYAFTEFSAADGFSRPEYIALISALCFSWFGDISILWSFSFGGAMFAVGNIMYTVFLVTEVMIKDISGRIFLYALPLCIIPCLMLVIFVRLGYMNLGKRSSKQLLIYLFTVSLHGSLGFLMMFMTDLTGLRMLGSGLFLFMLSDCILFIHEFGMKERYMKKLSLIMNSATYFTGMLMTALSISYII